MKTKTINYYTIDELKEKFPDAYKKVIEKNRYFEVESYDWYDGLFDGYQETLTNVGFENAKIYFSGFGSQGDGACFDADCNIEKLIDHVIKNNLVRQIIEVNEKGYAPKRIENWKFTQLKTIKDHLSITIEKNANSSLYSHEYTRCIAWMTCRLMRHARIKRAVKLLTEAVEELRLTLSREIYRALEKEYFFLISDETVHEALKANERYYDKSGRPE